MNKKERPIINQLQSTKFQKDIDTAFKLQFTLKGHIATVFKMSLSPDGRILASPSSAHECNVRLWDVSSGTLYRVFTGHEDDVVCTAWSPDGKYLVSGSADNTIRVWNFETGKLFRVLKGHTSMVTSLDWSPDNLTLVSCSWDNTICLWDLRTESIIKILKYHSSEIESVAFSPDGNMLCSGSLDNTLIIYDNKADRIAHHLSTNNGQINSVAWTPDGTKIAVGSENTTVSIWDQVTGQQTNILEGHTRNVVSVTFLANGDLLASLSANGEAIFWRTASWTQVAYVKLKNEENNMTNIVFHPTKSMMIVGGFSNEEINIWDFDLQMLLGNTSAEPAVHYINAKVVLVGESGVGKSGLGIRIAEQRFRRTDSTHGAQFWQIPIKDYKVQDKDRPESQTELTLWDLAGQPEYRLVHQLFLDDTDVALLLFDCSDPNDPFRGVRYWTKVLKKQLPKHAIKLLVSARCDVSPVTVARQQINNILSKYNLDQHFTTSAKTNEGVDNFYKYVLEHVPWDKLPRTTTPKLFHVIREILLEQKEIGTSLIAMNEIKKEVEERYTARNATQAEIDTIISLLQARGFIYRLDVRPEMTIILVKPELINQYASSIIQAARNHPMGIGALPEREVLIGEIALFGFERLDWDQEKIILEATVELLIQHDLCFREMGFLVFPSQINIYRPDYSKAHPRIEVAYRFSGSIESIYASLVVRLSHTDHFQREEQWKYAVEFSVKNERLGFSMHQVEEGTGELEIYFEPGISEFDRVTFIRFITDHLRIKGIDIEEQIRLYCHKCDNEIKNIKAIENRIKNGKLDIPCQFCGTFVIIPRSIEERYRQDPGLVKKQQELVQIAERRTRQEVTEFKLNQQRYTSMDNSIIHFLHLSDLHLADKTQAHQYRMQLETDLIQNLKIRQLKYFIISGDIGNCSTKEEYEAAFVLVDGIVKRFGLDSRRIVFVPGNHDLNWEFSKKAYPFIFKDELPEPLPEGKYIPAGDAGALVLNDELYRLRFTNFNLYFYKKIYSGKEYSADYSQQAIITKHPDDRILFLMLNSSWQIDHHFRNRSGINMSSLTKALDQLQEGIHDDWLKIAVWHHPVNGKEMMSNDFMELLAVHGFQICMHGHIHEAIDGFQIYDQKRKMHIIGAGTFGAPAKEQKSGIPLQYNILRYDKERSLLRVNSRKKEKTNGAWRADARWYDMESPRAFYDIKL